MINNAGVFVSKPFTDYTAADYALVTGVNLAGFFWLTQRVIADMARRYGGHVVNISATLAEVADSTAPSALAALTKGGLAAATRSLAVEYASRGIRVNAVSPGIIRTPMRPADSYDSLGDRLPPLGRVGQVSNVVDAILFLESSPYITGEILHVDGGQTAPLTKGTWAGCPASDGPRARRQGRWRAESRRASCAGWPNPRSEPKPGFLVVCATRSRCGSQRR